MPVMKAGGTGYSSNMCRSSERQGKGIATARAGPKGRQHTVLVFKGGFTKVELKNVPVLEGCGAKVEPQ